jgi:hypothetical protein
LLAPALSNRGLTKITTSNHQSMLTKQKSSRKTIGRPTIMTPKTISELEYCFAAGFSDLEACAEVNISKSTLYNFQNSNPSFAKRKVMLKS